MNHGIKLQWVTDRAAYDMSFGLARDADAHNFFWQGMPYTRETEDDNIFQYKDQAQIDEILKGIINISSTSGLASNDPFLDELIADKDINDPEDIYNKLLNHYKTNNQMDQYRLLRDLKKDNPDGYLDDLLMGDQSTTVNKLRELQNQVLLTEAEGQYDEYDYDYNYDDDDIGLLYNTTDFTIDDGSGNFIINPNYNSFNDIPVAVVDNTSGYGEFWYRTRKR